MITLKLQRFWGQRLACAHSFSQVWAGRLTDGREAGYALTDALVAMLILSLALVTSLRAIGQAREAATAAWEVRRADSLIAHLLQTAPHSFDTTAGSSDGFAWSVATTTTGAERPVEVCRRAVSVQAQRSGRLYGAATLETCPIEPGA